MISRPPVDAELEPALSSFLATGPQPITLESIAAVRAAEVTMVTDEVLGRAGLTMRDVFVPGHGGVEICLGIVSSQTRDPRSTGPGIYYMHGGGTILGDRRTGLDSLFDWIHRHNAVVISVDYRLAPEHPDPTPVEDCYAGLVWTAAHAHELGIDPERLLLVGKSAGGGLAAGVALLARDRGGPALHGQLLVYPMLDDRGTTTSTLQFEDRVTWTRSDSDTSWKALLGERRGTDLVSVYSAPARATDLRGLPPTFIECGSCDVFRDEDVAYATALWASGVSAELHIWPGGYHGYEKYAPFAPISRQTIAARDAWVARLLEM